MELTPESIIAAQILANMGVPRETLQTSKQIAGAWSSFRLTPSYNPSWPFRLGELRCIEDRRAFGL